MTISLAFLAPDLVKAAIDGRLPYGMGIARLIDLPAEWPKAAERKRAERLKIARRLYQELVAQDPNRLITLRDGFGRAVARHDPRPEQDAPEIAPNLLS
jgi:hypothetical protein